MAAHVLLLLLATACSFDSSADFAGADNGSGADAGFFSPDARPAPDADRQLAADAGPPEQPDAAPGVPDGTLQSFPLPSPIELDGELDAAWQTVSFREYDISDSEQLLALPSYTADASLRFASMYDSAKLYFFFEITDDLLISDSSNLYNDDSVELYIDGLGDGSGPYASDDHWIVIGFDDEYQSLGPGAIGLTGGIETTNTGYNIEIALDRDAIGLDASASSLGFNVGLNDDDGAGDSGVDAYGLWHLPSGQSCANCCTEEDGNYAWCDTTRFGNLQLVP